MSILFLESHRQSFFQFKGHLRRFNAFSGHKVLRRKSRNFSNCRQVAFFINNIYFLRFEFIYSAGAAGRLLLFAFRRIMNRFEALIQIAFEQQHHRAISIKFQLPQLFRHVIETTRRSIRINKRNNFVFEFLPAKTRWDQRQNTLKMICCTLAMINDVRIKLNSSLWSKYFRPIISALW